MQILLSEYESCMLIKCNAISRSMAVCKKLDFYVVVFFGLNVAFNNFQSYDDGVWFDFYVKIERTHIFLFYLHRINAVRTRLEPATPCLHGKCSSY